MTQNKRIHRAGVAMMLVIVAVAIAAVLGYATLALVGREAQISGNALRIAQADSLAQSGFNYAMYQLEKNPGSVPWSSPANLTLGNPNATYSCSIALVGSTPIGSDYSITATGTVGTGVSSPAVMRTITAFVQLTTSPVPYNCAAAINTCTVGTGMAINGSVSVSPTGMVTMNGGTLTGSILPEPNPNAAPTSIYTANYYPNYTVNGQPYTAVKITADPAAGTTLGPTAGNPAGIFYYSTNSVLNLKGVTINGTLLIKNGGVLVKGSSVNTITPQAGYPALVISQGTSNVSGAGYLEVNGGGNTLTVNGLVWSQNGISNYHGVSTTGSTVTINGSLMSPAPSPFSYDGSLNLNYTAANVSVPNFGSSSSTASATLRLLSWSE